MNVFDFITLQECEAIVNSVATQGDFELEATHNKKYSFRLRNGKAGIDFADGTKQGEYIVHGGFSKLYGDYAGIGFPLTGDDLEIFETAETLLKWVDDLIKSRNIEGYETLENTVEQLTLF